MFRVSEYLRINCKPIKIESNQTWNNLLARYRAPFVSWWVPKWQDASIMTIRMMIMIMMYSRWSWAQIIYPKLKYTITVLKWTSRYTHVQHIYFSVIEITISRSYYMSVSRSTSPFSSFVFHLLCSLLVFMTLLYILRVVPTPGSL